MMYRMKCLFCWSDERTGLTSKIIQKGEKLLEVLLLVQRNLLLNKAWMKPIKKGASMKWSYLVGLVDNVLNGIVFNLTGCEEYGDRSVGLSAYLMSLVICMC